MLCQHNVFGLIRYYIWHDVQLHSYTNVQTLRDLYLQRHM